jgi:hypothetical protein
MHDYLSDGNINMELVNSGDIDFVVCQELVAADSWPVHCKDVEVSALTVSFDLCFLFSFVLIAHTFRRWRYDL